MLAQYRPRRTQYLQAKLVNRPAILDVTTLLAQPLGATASAITPPAGAASLALVANSMAGLRLALQLPVASAAFAAGVPGAAMRQPLPLTSLLVVDTFNLGAASQPPAAATVVYSYQGPPAQLSAGSAGGRPAPSWW